jgi:hypothetical protein
MTNHPPSHYGPLQPNPASLRCGCGIYQACTSCTCSCHPQLFLYPGAGRRVQAHPNQAAARQTYLSHLHRYTRLMPDQA